MATRNQQHTLLVQTGPGTPMGELFRRYWQPILLSEELPAPDCPPVRVKILSEKLLAFRDTEGKLGLIDEFCAHRGVSLWFGRNEECGLRCPYHGWKFDVNGECLEIPSERNSGLNKKIKLTSYPLIEKGGIIWTYMGPPEHRPPEPQFEFTLVGPKQRYVSKRLQNCNYLQAMEGGIDPHHVSFLHSGELRKDPLIGNSNTADYIRPDLDITTELGDTAGGIAIAYGRGEPGKPAYWRVMQWVVPNFTLIPPFAQHAIHGHFWVPLDDEHCFAWTFDYHPQRELTEDELAAARLGKGLHTKVDAEFRPLIRRENDYLMDRAKQRDGTFYSGIEGIAMQDASLQESMGPIQDRTKEHLVASDRPIMMARRRLYEAAVALQQGVEPPGLKPEAQCIRSATTLLSPGANIFDAVREATVAREGVPYLTA